MASPLKRHTVYKKTKGFFDEANAMTLTNGRTMPYKTFDLPAVGTPEGISRGRSVRDGYRRGWGLQFDGLQEKVAGEPLYQSALECSGGWSIMAHEKRMNLYLIITRFFDSLQDHNIVEFGSYRGGNALFMAYVLKYTYPEARVYALDTFAGMPETDPSRDFHEAGCFGDASVEALIDRRNQMRLDNLVPIKGLFQDTFPQLAETRFALAHVDCDIYDAVKYCQISVWPQITSGGYLVYDDADVSSCIGATEAVEDMIIDQRLHSEQVWPHWVFRKSIPS